MNISLTRLKSFYSDLKPPLLLHAMIRREFPGSIAVLTSMGRDSGLLLSLVAAVEPSTPVLFLDTGKHFKETLDYARTITTHLALTNVRHVKPDPALLDAQDREGNLWQKIPEQCCRMRKTEPLTRMLEAMGCLALITGRGREQPPEHRLETFELDENGIFRINPLAGLAKEAQNTSMTPSHLPPHPLAGPGYAAIGCETCTLKAQAENSVAGRWALAAAFEETPHAASAPASTSDWSV